MKSFDVSTCVGVLMLCHLLLRVEASICEFADRYEIYVECIDTIMEQCKSVCQSNQISCVYCTVNVAQQLLCPNNTHLSGGYCVPATTSCPKDTVLLGGLCQDVNRIQCPKSYTYADGVCFNDKVSELCVSDFKSCPIPNTDCQKTFGNCRTRFICPPNQIIFNGGCVTSSLATCPTGYQIINSNCICNSTKACPNAVCPLGSSMVNGTCNSDIQCPIDKMSLNGLCVQCPSNLYYMNQRCNQCSTGSQLYNGRCVTSQVCSIKQILINGECTPLFCYGKRCCKDIECNFCFKYCEEHSTFTANLSRCEERCIDGGLPMDMFSIGQPSNIQLPITQLPTTLPPANITQSPATQLPTTEWPTTELPTTEELTTEWPTTELPTTEDLTTEWPTTELPTTEELTTEWPTTELSTTEATEPPTTELASTQPPSTRPSITQSPITRPPVTRPPTTQVPTTRFPTTRLTTTKTSIIISPPLIQPPILEPIIQPPSFFPPCIVQPPINQPPIIQPQVFQPLPCSPPIIQNPYMSWLPVVQTSIDLPQNPPVIIPQLPSAIKENIISRPRTTPRPRNMINITNIINSSNTKNVITNINHSNINNIDLTSGTNSSGVNGEIDDCCVIVEPKECKNVQGKWKCYHRKYHTCGSLCTTYDCEEEGCSEEVVTIEMSQQHPVPQPFPIPQQMHHQTMLYPIQVPIPQPFQYVMQTVHIPQLQHCVSQQQNGVYWTCPPQHVGTTYHGNKHCYPQNQWPFVQCIPNLRFDCSNCHMGQCNPVCY